MPDWIQHYLTSQQYFFNGTHAYTEDFVLIYNLGIHEPTKGVNTDFVRQYTVEKYGRVKDCNFSDETRDDTQSNGVICFDDPKHAALMLRNTKHEDMGKSFSVGPLFSWLQPNPHLAVHPVANANLDGEGQEHQQSGEEETARINVDVSPESSQFSLLQDNEYCLHKILHSLSLVDQIQFARTCKRFLEVFLSYMSYEYTTFCLKDVEDFTIWQMRDFISYFGEFVEDITFPQYCFVKVKAWVDIIIIGCPNVTTLSVEYVHSKSLCFTKLWHTDSRIRELTFLKCDLSFNSKCLEDIGLLKRLKSLSLNGSNCAAGLDLNRLPSSLKKLFLKNCNIPSESFLSAVNKLINLTVLDLRGCDWLTKRVFQSITRNCCKLKKLGLRCSIGVASESIRPLKRLKELLLEYSLTPIYSVCHIFLKNVVKSHSESLEMLRICGDGVALIMSEHAGIIAKLSNLKKLYLTRIANLDDSLMMQFKELLNLEELRLDFCTRFSIDGLLYFLMSRPKLKHLNIEGCLQITKEDIAGIIVLLKNQFRTGERRQKLNLMLPGSAIDDDVVTEDYLLTHDFESVLNIVHNYEANDSGDCYTLSDSYNTCWTE